MIVRSLTMTALALASPAMAEETRGLDAHAHGTGQVNIAFDGDQIAIELLAPGADIVGFEYAPSSDDDRAAVASAIATLSQPLTLITLPAAAGCGVVEAAAALEGEDDHDHGHDDHEDHDDHDDHAGHDDHDDHDEHDHETAEADTHAEFHATYVLACADIDAVDTIDFTYFGAFPNAQKLEVQMITDAGSTGFDVTRDASSFDLRGIF